MSTLSRRSMMMGLPLVIAGCATSQPQGTLAAVPPFVTGDNAADYGPIADEPYPVRAVNLARVDPELLRQAVAYSGPYEPGTLIVDLTGRRLYLIQTRGSALRYGVGVGRQEALNFRGSAVIGRKAEWPTWTPTESMMQSIPRYRAYAGGMPGGAENPLGPRALYLYRDNEDTHFRLHGTTEPQSIGKAVSSGCIRLFNQDIIDLYKRVPVGADLVVQA
jgi:lipoprotein-anchoring transpeptidase ErfK/SrfK